MSSYEASQHVAHCMLAGAPEVCPGRELMPPQVRAAYPSAAIIQLVSTAWLLHVDARLAGTTHDWCIPALGPKAQ